ncbi:MAG: hypothetical protein NXI30_28335 [bacterium]|nr:hypothetical protein [bacterium]
MTGWSFLVFEADEPNATLVDGAPSACLRSKGAARFLEKRLDYLYSEVGFGISESDDACTNDPAVLAAVILGLNSLYEELSSARPEWRVQLGYEFRPGEELGPPIYAQASRDEIRQFLRESISICETARENAAYLVWGGGA